VSRVPDRSNERASTNGRPGLPSRVELDLKSSARELWLARARQHTTDSYVGIPMAKFPEDLRTYEHLLWEMRANVVIELGTWSGASALWFRDRLQTMHAYGRVATPRVITVDLDQREAVDAVAAVDPTYEGTITFLEADVRDQTLPEQVEHQLPEHARCLVVEDSAHVYETTYAALLGFARFVPVRGYLVVEDGCVDVEEMRLDDSWPRGVLPAVADWLTSPDGQRFQVRRDLELYGMSCHPGGFLQRAR
jgi:cephalosporin hydroxylase